MQADTILGPEAQNTLKIVKQHEKEIEDFNEEKKTLKDQIKIQEKDLAQKEKHQKKFYAQFKELFNKRDKLNAEINKIENKVRSKEDNKRKLEQKTNVHSLEQAKNKAELSGFEEENKQYEDVEIYKNKPQDNKLW